MKKSGLILLLILVFGASMMLKVDRHGHFEIKAWGSSKTGDEKMYAIVPVMSLWKHYGMLQMFARRVRKAICDMSQNIIRVNIGNITMNKCEFIQIKRLMEEWNIDVSELCRHSLMSVVNAHTDLITAR